jgi:hypothetical protein
VPISFAFIALILIYSVCIPYIIYIRDKTEVTPNGLHESKQVELDAERAKREVANDKHSAAQNCEDSVAEQVALKEMLDSESKISILERAIKVLSELL